MPAQRKMAIGWLIESAGTHAAGWQKFADQPDIANDIKHFAKMAQEAEAAKLDFIFQADSSSIRPGPLDAVARNSTYANMLEPFTQMAALSQLTSRIGLASTACTSFWEPFNLARLAASVDHISGGRFGWNIVTGRHPLAAPNFGQESIGHADRYHRAHEFTEVVLGLWDSYEDDAFCRDVESGYYFDPAKIHALNHAGEYYKVRGPLNLARPPQGYPVLFQAGSSGDGKDFGARFGEVIFSINGTLEKAREFYEDIKQRMMKYGRERDEMRVLSALNVIVRDTAQEAADAFAEMQHMLHPQAIKHMVSVDLETDVMDLDIDDYVTVDRLPQDANSSKSADALLHEWLAERPMTVRELYYKFCQSRSANTIHGTANQVADVMEEWFTAGVADGFMMLFPLATGMSDFGTKVVPELQRRGLFRTEYEGKTLREHLGLKSPPHRLRS
ncbi:NtaA/DmoA family FMN-dependent monooxygenase [Rhizorhapis suberifaciens]|uniref:FMN-dependent oxidoreductase (Nitrilotriacetate monooxygenase family) n=1 Tax=Rhizorhapis suberifaciens TaxID=13656 RepID=A0A840HYS9_9SPHN|nr:NtaA/DmoA family FMN-dependent monooxygenase [Rhizorhapis suberifaciens]MBB4642811.1 FMN-dependent oxidoreductase (nitrilotriacetate monooxygenase family) [Rhizorhapis suberifaciens]